MTKRTYFHGKHHATSWTLDHLFRPSVDKSTHNDVKHSRIERPKTDFPNTPTRKTVETRAKMIDYYENAYMLQQNNS
jgi:hypothetical protein